MSHEVRMYAVLARDAAMSTTYKPALLKAIVRAQRAEPCENIGLMEIAEQFARLYWTQTVVFHLRQASSIAKEPQIIQNLRRAATEASTRSFERLPIDSRSRLIRSIAGTLRVDVLRRFHNSAILSGSRVLVCLLQLEKTDRLPNVQFIDRLDQLNERRLAVDAEVMRGSIALPTGGVRVLYNSARDVEWPNAWEPASVTGAAVTRTFGGTVGRHRRRFVKALWRPKGDSSPP